MSLKKILLTSFIFAICALALLFLLVYLDGENLFHAFARSDGRFIMMGTFLGAFAGCFIALKMLLKTSLRTKFVFIVLIMTCSLVWYEYETATIHTIFHYCSDADFTLGCWLDSL